jgi:2-oxoglutarate ferredoxin oxidoreductase subunit gamma
MSERRIRIAGFGGQGMILSGYILGKAAAIYDNKSATQVQSYGPESRGGACSSQVVISDGDIDTPFVNYPDILVTMSQEAYDTYESSLNKGLLLIDEDLVKPLGPPAGIELKAIPATRLAEELGNKVVANVVMLGFFTAVTNVVSVEAMKEAVSSSVRERFVKLNLKAFDRGYEYGKQQLEEAEGIEK